MKRYVENDYVEQDGTELGYTLSDLISQVPGIREKLARHLYQPKGYRNMQEWEETTNEIRSSCFHQADAILNLFKEEE